MLNRLRELRLNKLHIISEKGQISKGVPSQVNKYFCKIPKIVFYRKMFSICVT